MNSFKSEVEDIVDAALSNICRIDRDCGNR